MVKLFSCLLSLVNRSKKGKFQFDIESLPEHLIIAVFNKMPGRTFCRTYSTCHYMADLADRGRGKLAVRVNNPPNLSIEYKAIDPQTIGVRPYLVCPALPKIVLLQNTPVKFVILKVSYPIPNLPKYSNSPPLSVLTSYPQDIADIPLLLSKFCYFQFNRVAIWTVKYSEKEEGKALASILRRLGIKCCSLMADDEELLPSLVSLMRPKELDIKTNFDFGRIPRLLKTEINIVGFHPRSWEKINDELLPQCGKVQLEIDMTSEATALEIMDFIEKMFQLHLPKIAVSIQLPRTMFHDCAFDGAVFNRMMTPNDLAIYTVVKSRTCTVLIYDRETSWQLRTFSLYREIEQFLESHRKFRKQENRAELENLLEQAKTILEE